MMKSIKIVAVCLAFALLNQSCARVLYGPASECQKTKPAPGQAHREVRVGLALLECWFIVPIIIDVATCAIYKPCTKESLGAEQRSKAAGGK